MVRESVINRLGNDAKTRHAAADGWRCWGRAKTNGQCARTCHNHKGRRGLGEDMCGADHEAVKVRC
jgi:hypothetical protein